MRRDVNLKTINSIGENIINDKIKILKGINTGYDLMYKDQNKYYQYIEGNNVSECKMRKKGPKIIKKSKIIQ